MQLNIHYTNIRMHLQNNKTHIQAQTTTKDPAATRVKLYNMHK